MIENSQPSNKCTNYELFHSVLSWINFTNEYMKLFIKQLSIITVNCELSLIN